MRLFVDCGLIMGGSRVSVGVRRLYRLCMVTAFVLFCGVAGVSICAMVYSGIWCGVGFLLELCRFLCRSSNMYVFCFLFEFYFGFYLCVVRLKCTLWKTVGFDMSFDTFSESAAICSWMYMRKASLAHRPSFLMVVMGTLFRYIAIAPPARRLCEPTRFGDSP